MTDLIPGLYLYRSRIQSPKGLLSYLWLEVAPSLLVALVTLGAGHALAFFLSHFAVLSLYEIGYLHNDRSVTASERGDTRAKVRAISVWPFVGARALLMAVCSAGLFLRFGVSPAVLLLLGSLALLTALYVHTWLGARIGMFAPARVISFAWLAGLKYLPANAAVLGVEAALSVCVVLFVIYGGGRVLEYALAKHRGDVRPGTFDVNSAWFVGVLPLTPALLTLLDARVTLACLAVVASHHLLKALLRVKPFAARALSARREHHAGS